MHRARWYVLVLLILSRAAQANAETGYDAWLRYPRLDDSIRDRYASIPRRLMLVGDSTVLRTARDETIRGLSSMLGEPVVPLTSRGSGSVIVMGLLDRIRMSMDDPGVPTQLRADGYWIGRVVTREGPALVVAGQNERGVLYGAFGLLRRIAAHGDLSQLNDREEPAAPVRWINHWDNLDGTIERGYAGRSIFFEGGRVVDDLTRVRDYARLLASVGINGLTINNVNANAVSLQPAYIAKAAAM